MKGCSVWFLIFLIVPACIVQVKSQLSSANPCRINHVPCDDSECILKEQWCNGKEDCSDASDEKYCKRKGIFSSGNTNKCQLKHFACQNTQCVPISTKCDGFENCYDGSDEYSCDKTEEEESYSGETTSNVPFNPRADHVPDHDFFDSDFFDSDYSTEITETQETTTSPSYMVPIIPVSRTSSEGYYDRRIAESTTDQTSNFDYNREQHVHPQYTHNQEGSQSHIYDNSRRGQIPHHSTVDEIVGYSQINGHNSLGQTDDRYTNSQHSNEGNIRSGHSIDTIVKFPPRVFPRAFQPSNLDTRYINSQHGSEGNVRSGHSNEASVTFSTHIFPTTTQPPVSEAYYTNNQYGNAAYARSENPGGTFVRFPPRVFPRTFQPSNLDTRYTNSQHGSEGNVGSGHSDGASVTFSTYIFPPTAQPPVSEAHYTNNQYGNEAYVRSEHLGETFVRFPPRIFPRTAHLPPYPGNDMGQIRRSNPLQQLANAPLHTQYSESISTFSADHPTPFVSHDQPADRGNVQYGIQSDVSQPRNLEQFYFRTNYTNSFKNTYKDAVQRAERWILNQRISSYGWDENTPRALIALSLVTNTFSFKYPENELMKKSLATRFGIKMRLMRDNQNGLSNRTSSSITNSTLATYVNALLATCQDPKQFFNNDLTNELRLKTTHHGTDVNPLVYLTLCLTNTPVEYDELISLINLLTMKYEDERSSDMQILATTALACFQRMSRYKEYLEQTVKEAFRILLQKRLSDNSFGSVYSTALTAQALMSIDTNDWSERDAKKTMDFLIKHQLKDGSFGDMLATYYVLPVLSGRSLLHLRNTQCDPVPKPPPASTTTRRPGLRIAIFYSIIPGAEYPMRSNASMYLEIPQGSNFLYAMKEAEQLNSQFRFFYKELENRKPDVHTIMDIPNDTERGFRWKLYVIDNASEEHVINLRNWYTEDVATLIPKNNQEFVYWYLPLM